MNVHTTPTILTDRQRQKMSRDATRKKAAIIQYKSEFPLAVHERINAASNAASNNDNNSIAAEEFLRRICIVVRNVLFLLGLDRNRNIYTGKEVETMIRFFPELLSEKDDLTGECLIQHQRFVFLNGNGNGNLDFDFENAYSFVPLFAKLGIELGQFEEADRGGLFLKFPECQQNVLQFIVCCFYICEEKKLDKAYSKHHQSLDERILAVLNKLRELKLLKKEDILQHNLLGLLCTRNYEEFPDKRFNFFCDWNQGTQME